VKSVDLDRPDLTLERVLQEAAGGDVVFLTAAGETRFASMALNWTEPLLARWG